MPQIHPTAIVARGARLAGDVVIGPYCVIGEHVELAAGVSLRSHVVIDGRTTIGERNIDSAGLAWPSWRSLPPSR